MDVVSDEFVASMRQELVSVFRAFEAMTGLQAMFRTMSEGWRGADDVDIVLPPYHEHRSPFCLAMKATAFAACAKCDVLDLPAVCSPPPGPVTKPFVRTCHAGVDEVLLPLWVDRRLVGVLFVGQFVRQADGAPTGDAATGDAATGDAATGVAVLSEDRIEHVRDLTLPLRSYLLDTWRELDVRRRAGDAGRVREIRSYVRDQLAHGPTLTGLAAKLNLSPSRTSHVVRQVTRRSFRELVEESRLTAAKDLLQNTDGTIAWVARQIGFGDTAYFCKYFKEKVGATPTGYRRANRRGTWI